MAQLGGGGSQSAWGYQTVSSPNFDGGDFQIERAAGIAAGVGPDVPSSCLEWLENIGIDIRGIQQHPNAKTPRAWQILEQDGRRHELLKDLRHALDKHRSRNGTGLLSIETFTKASTKIQPDGDLWAAIELCDIFSPNEEEARSILGLSKLNRDTIDAEILKLTSPFIDAGARWCSLRRGAGGVVVHEKSSTNVWSIPVVADTNVVDTTGCGNAFCGAFLAGIQSRSGAEVAGMLATAAASVMAEHQGVPQGLNMGKVRAEVRRRSLNLETRLL
ncbi:putative Uncharacterized protein C16C9.01c [Nannochloris sp. 'desiccata']|nr:hypothetical protein KSW81_006352 [Chlorella desiccata (nom. nud.)]KAH7622619.1 putative Uncharacterized protein C16C9.01c [Chlorella desiccata (nom. nud.)]